MLSCFDSNQNIPASHVVKIIGKSGDRVDDGFRVPIRFVFDTRSLDLSLIEQIDNIYR